MCGGMGGRHPIRTRGRTRARDDNTISDTDARLYAWSHPRGRHSRSEGTQRVYQRSRGARGPPTRFEGTLKRQPVLRRTSFLRRHVVFLVFDRALATARRSLRRSLWYDVRKTRRSRGPSDSGVGITTTNRTSGRFRSVQSVRAFTVSFSFVYYRIARLVVTTGARGSCPSEPFTRENTTAVPSYATARVYTKPETSFEVISRPIPLRVTA